MENQAATRREVDDEEGVGSGTSDRISRLPESVLHYILCFLSQKKAVQTSVLSKSWRHLGPTRPVIHLRGACDRYHARSNKFCEECFNGNKETFLSVVDNTFQRYYDHNLSAQEILLKMLRLDSHSISILEKWIPIFINPDKPALTTFFLSVSNNWTCLELPSAVFKAESLENLYLHNCIISSIKNAVLKNLQKLRLSYVYVKDETLEKVMSGCPLLEYFVLYKCEGLETISIANANQHLKEFRFFAYNVPTFQSWKLDRNNFFPHLKSLYLFFVRLSTESFEYFSCNFPLLEEFTLHCCLGFQEIKLFSHSLKRLTIRLGCSIKVDINAPNLLHFKLVGWIFPTTIYFTTTSREWKSKIILKQDKSTFDDAMPGLLKLNEMLKALSQSQISLDISERLFYKRKQIECGIHDPVAVEHLNISSSHLRLDLNPIPRLFHALFQICRPRYIFALSGLRSPRYYGLHGTRIGTEVAECIWETLIHERGNKECYWQQFFEEAISVEVYDFGESVWQPTTCLPECASNHQKIRFGFKWRHILKN